MSVIYPFFLSEILQVHQNISEQIAYPFFDPACIKYEALRAVAVDNLNTNSAINKFGISEHEYKKARQSFYKNGTYGLIGNNAKQLTEPLDVEIERMVYVLKKARPEFPATKMSILLQGFGHDLKVGFIRHIFASYGLAQGTKAYSNIDFEALNLKVAQLYKYQQQQIIRNDFFCPKDKLQMQLEVFRTLWQRGVTKRFGNSIVTFEQYKKYFLSYGLLGLVEKSRPAFRNSKLGYKQEGLLIFSKIQAPDNDSGYYQEKLKTKDIYVDKSSINKIFRRWKTQDFQSCFKGDLRRLLKDEISTSPTQNIRIELPEQARNASLDSCYISFIKGLENKEFPLANPGVFLFAPYLEKLKIYDKIVSLMGENDKSYGWFTLLLLNINRILAGISSVSKACKISELSIPLSAGLVNMPCNDSILNGLSQISEEQLLELRKFLTQQTSKNHLIENKRVAFDFSMRDYNGQDIDLKKIGKGPSPKRKICFPGFRPHIAWDVDCGIPVVIEFRNAKTRATTSIKRFIKELIQDAIGIENIEHIYIDSEYTAEHVWNYISDKENGLGADLTMCVKQNKKVKKYINQFLETQPKWHYFDEKHTYTTTTFTIPIADAELQCVLKRDEKTHKTRCFGSTIAGLDALGILEEYKNRWTIENGIKDLNESYFFDKIPGIEPHRINVHYFCVTLAKILFEMLLKDYKYSHNKDNTKKTLSTLRTEFLSATNAIMKRQNDKLIIKWIDLYPEQTNKALLELFEKINQRAQTTIKHLGGMKLRFEISHPKPKEMKNTFKKISAKF